MSKTANNGNNHGDLELDCRDRDHHQIRQIDNETQNILPVATLEVASSQKLRNRFFNIKSHFDIFRYRSE